MTFFKSSLKKIEKHYDFERYTISNIVFKSFIHLEFIFVYG